MPKPVPQEPVLGGVDSDGGLIREVYMDRLVITSFASFQDMVYIIGNTGTSLSVGSGQNPYVNASVVDMPFGKFGSFGRNSHTMGTRSDDTQGPGQNHATDGDCGNLVVIATGANFIFAAPLYYADAIVRGFISAGISVHRHLGQSAWQLLESCSTQCTAQQFCQGLVSSGVPSHDCWFHRFGRMDLVPTRLANETDCGWLSLTHGLALDEIQFAKSEFFKSLCRTLSQGNQWNL